MKQTFLQRQEKGKMILYNYIAWQKVKNNQPSLHITNSQPQPSKTLQYQHVRLQEWPGHRVAIFYILAKSQRRETEA